MSERLPEILGIRLDHVIRRQIEEARDTERTVDHEQSQFAGSGAAFPLEQTVDEPDRRREVTKEVTFDGVFHGVVDDPWGNTKAGFTATANIDRQDFNVKWNQTLDAGGVVVGNDVAITLELELGMVK